MDGFTPVSSVTQWPMVRLGYGSVAGAETALARRDAFLDAVLGRPPAGDAWKIPEPGSSQEASGVLGKRADWLAWAADSVKDRLDLSAAFTLAAWKTDSGSVSTLLDADAGKRSPGAYPSVSDGYREALSGGTPGRLPTAASGGALSEIYARLMRGNTVSSLYSVWA